MKHFKHQEHPFKLYVKIILIDATTCFEEKGHVIREIEGSDLNQRGLQERYHKERAGP